MTIASGIGSQLGFVAEPTPGTRVTPTRFTELLSESVKFQQDYVVGKGIKTGRRVARRRHKMGGYAAGGIQLELAPQATALLWKHALGGNSTTGAGPYTHVATPGAMDALALTIQFNRPDISGTDRIFEYAGAAITGWQLGIKYGEVATFGFDIYAMTETVNQSLASASYPATWTPFTCVQLVVSIGGSAYDIHDMTLTGNNNLATGRHQIRSTTPGAPKKSLEMGTREYGGVINSDFVDLTAYARATAQTAAALSAVFTSGSHTLTVAGNIEFDTDTVNITGEDTLKQGLPFVFVSETSDAAAITVTTVNGDSAA